MAKQRNRKPARRRDKKGGPGSGRRKPCLFCKDKVEQVDYKDVETLRKFISERRQDPLAPHHRRLPPPPEPGGPRGQARPRARAAALRRRGARRARDRRPRRSRPRPRSRPGALGRCPRPSSSRTSRASARRAPSSTSPRATSATSSSRASSRSRRRQGAVDAARRKADARARRAGRGHPRPGVRRPAQPHGPDDLPAGRRRRPPVRLGHQPGHRRRDPRGARHPRRQAQGPPRGPDQARRHLHGRRGGRRRRDRHDQDHGRREVARLAAGTGCTPGAAGGSRRRQLAQGSRGASWIRRQLRDVGAGRRPSAPGPLLASGVG